jgi:N6-adenosine-specific RNA methylase IME4
MSADGTSIADVGRAFWARRIKECVGSAVEAIIATGRALIDAKASLPHGEFESMVREDLEWHPSHAVRLMKIARDERLTNPAHVQDLPTACGTLYELSKLKGCAFEEALADGRISPDMERRDAAVLRTGERRIQRLANAERLSRAAPPLNDITPAPARRWPVVYADPPWKHRTWSEAGKEKSPENHYPTLSHDELKALPVSALAADRAALFMWTTVGHLAEAIELIAAWGFVYKSHLVWLKTYPNGAPHRGTGYWFINTHELLLLGTRGDIPAPIMGTQEESVISAPVGRHSEKPACFYELIERYFPEVGRIELFARARREGWECWGNEVDPA